MDMINQENQLQDNQEKECSCLAKKEKIIKISWFLSELLLFIGIVFYALQPILVLIGRAYALPITIYGVFFTSSVVCLIAIFIRFVLFAVLTCSKGNFSAKEMLDGFLGKWEIFALTLAFIWTMISTAMAEKQNIVWGGNSYNVEGFWAVVKYGTIFLDAYLIKSAKFKKLFCSTLVISGAIMGAILLLVNIYDIPFYFHFTRSVYWNSNHYGYALSVSATLAVGLALYDKKIWKKVLYLLCFGVLHANMLVSDCFGSFMGEICGIIAVVLFYLLKERNKELLIGILAVVLVFVGVTAVLETTRISNVVTEDLLGVVKDTGDITQGEASGSEGSGRWELWVKTIEVIKKVPLYGKGLDCYYNNNLIDSSLDMPHNEYIQIASNVGLPTLIFYMSAIIGIYVRAFLSRREIEKESIICLGAGVGYLVSALFGNTFTYTYPFLLIVLALGMLKQRRKQCQSS